jgi:DNA-binding PadR family transcriptional regulator
MRTKPSPFAPLTPLTYHILTALEARPLHAYAIRQQVAHDSGASVTISTGTLHHALENLLRHHCIEDFTAQSDGKRRYRLTDYGRHLFEQELARLKQAVVVGTLAQTGTFTWN